MPQFRSDRLPNWRTPSSGYACFSLRRNRRPDGGQALPVANIASRKRKISLCLNSDRTDCQTGEHLQVVTPVSRYAVTEDLTVGKHYLLLTLPAEKGKFPYASIQIGQTAKLANTFKWLRLFLVTP